MARVTDLLPLRSSAVWAEFASVQPIPIRYGRTAGECVPYSADRRTWVWADHPVQGVDAVTIDGDRIDAWEHRNGLDSTGQAVAFVVFADPVDPGVTPVAAGRGKVGVGGLTENPADVILDLCALAGVAEPDVSDLWADAAASSLRLAYSISERRTLQAELRDIAESIGGLYSSGIPGYVRLLPSSAAVLATVRAHQVAQIRCVLDTLQTRIVARYGYQDGDPTAGLESAVIAPDADILAQIDLPCVADGRTAADVVRRRLQRYGRPAWIVSAAGVSGRLLPGDRVAVEDTDVPGVGTVLSSTWDAATDRSTAEVEVPVGAAPLVQLVRQGSAVAFERPAGGTVVTVDGERIITITYTDGAPIVGARVILGDVTRFTDGAGRVSFPADLMPPGQHELLVIPPDAQDDEGYVMVVVV